MFEPGSSLMEEFGVGAEEGVAEVGEAGVCLAERVLGGERESRIVVDVGNGEDIVGYWSEGRSGLVFD